MDSLAALIATVSTFVTSHAPIIAILEFALLLVGGLWSWRQNRAMRTQLVGIRELVRRFERQTTVVRAEPQSEALAAIPMSTNGKDVARAIVIAPGVADAKRLYGEFMKTAADKRLFEYFAAKALEHALQRHGKRDEADEVHRKVLSRFPDSLRTDIEFALLLLEWRRPPASEERD